MFDLPSALSTTVIFLIFVASLILCHAALVWVFPLGKNGWRVVDYIWLLVTAVGLIGLTAQGREMWATNIARAYDRASSSWHDPLFGFVQPPSREDIACMKFNSQLYRTPEELQVVQDDQDRYRAWYKQVTAVLAGLDPKVGEVDRSTFPEFPKLKGPVYEQYSEDFESFLESHNRFARTKMSLDDARVRSEGEMLVAFLSPMFIAVALALRITKISGEWRLEILAEAAKAEAARASAVSNPWVQDSPPTPFVPEVEVSPPDPEESSPNPSG